MIQLFKWIFVDMFFFVREHRAAVVTPYFRERLLTKYLIEQTDNTH